MLSPNHDESGRCRGRGVCQIFSRSGKHKDFVSRSPRFALAPEDDSSFTADGHPPAG